jgi:hypothetical protein
MWWGGKGLHLLLARGLLRWSCCSVTTILFLHSVAWWAKADMTRHFPFLLASSYEKLVRLESRNAKCLVFSFYYT